MKYILFGASLLAEKLLYNYEVVTGMDIHYFVDNDKKKWYQKFMGKYMIYPPAKLLEDDLSDKTVVITSIYLDEIKAQLTEMGIRADIGFYNTDKKYRPMNKLEIINHCLGLYENSRYLEMGVTLWDDFVNISAKHKEGIGINTPGEQIKNTFDANCRYFQITSDEYFQELPSLYDGRLFDVIYIDGFDEYTKVYQDILNGLNYLDEYGVIIVRGCKPVNNFTALTSDEPAEANEGTYPHNVNFPEGWKAIVLLRSLHKNVRVFTLDCDHGCAVITKETADSVLTYDAQAIDLIDFEYFNSHSAYLLNLKPASYLFEFLQKSINRASHKLKLYVENFMPWLKYSRQDYLIDDNVKTVEVDNGILLPLRIYRGEKDVTLFEGGACDNELNFIAGFTRNKECLNTASSCSSGYKVDLSKISRNSETIVFCGYVFPHFGHFFLESLSRLWWVLNNKNTNYRFAFLSNLPDIPQIYIEIFRMLGIKEEKLFIIDRPMQFNKIIIPDYSFYVENGFTKEWIGIYDHIRDSVIPGKYEKIYLSRTKLQKTNCINESYYEEFFNKQGYEIIYPEKLNIREQIEIMSGAKSVACTGGTLSHLALFCQNNIEFIILNRCVSQAPLAHQIMINQVRNIKCTFIDASCNLLPVIHNGPAFLLYPTKQWEKYLNDNNITNDTVSRHINDLMPEYLRSWANLYKTTPFLSRFLDEIPSFEIAENIIKYTKDLDV